MTIKVMTSFCCLASSAPVIVSNRLRTTSNGRTVERDDTEGDLRDEVLRRRRLSGREPKGGIEKDVQRGQQETRSAGRSRKSSRGPGPEPGPGGGVGEKAAQPEGRSFPLLLTRGKRKVELQCLQDAVRDQGKER